MRSLIVSVRRNSRFEWQDAIIWMHRICTIWNAWFMKIMIDALSLICINEQEYICSPLDIRSRGEKHTQYMNERYIMETLKTRLSETKMAEQSCFLQHRGHGEDNENACFGTYTISLYGKWWEVHDIQYKMIFFELWKVIIINAWINIKKYKRCFYVWT